MDNDGHGKTDWARNSLISGDCANIIGQPRTLGCRTLSPTKLSKDLAENPEPQTRFWDRFGTALAQDASLRPEIAPVCRFTFKSNESRAA